MRNPAVRSLRLLRKIVSRNQAKRRLFFLHVPKCGGTSLRHAIARGFSAESTFQLCAEASVRAAELTNRPLHEFRRDLLLCLMASPKLRYITGHFWYSNFVYEQFGNEWDFVTLLREPVSRWFSHYFYNTRNRCESWRVEESLSEFLKTDQATLYGRFYTHIFAAGETTNGRIPTARDAIEALERFAVVGILEELGDFCDALKRRFGLTVKVPVLNRNPVAQVERNQQISDEIREQVRELCQPDLEVYEHVRARVAPTETLSGAKAPIKAFE